MAVSLNAKSLLETYRESQDLEIDRLLTQYGSSLKDVREMYPQLTSAIEARKLATAFPTQELFFTASEAVQMGLNLQEDWMLKLSPAGEDYSISFVTPEKWELTEGGMYISPAGERYTRGELEALLSTQWETPPEWQAPGEVELTEAGQRLYQEYQAGGGKLDVGGWVQEQQAKHLEVEEIFGKVFPEQDIQEVLDYMRDQPAEFLADIREIGPTEDMVAFLKTLEFEDDAGNIRYLSDAEIADFFGTVAIPEFQAEGWLRDNILDPLYAGAAAFAHGLKMAFTSIIPSVMTNLREFWVRIERPILPSGLEEFHERDIEIIQAGAEEQFFRLRDANDAWFLEHPELTPKPEYLEDPFKNPELFRDPGYYAYSFTSSLAYSLSVMGTLVAVSAAAGPGVGIPTALLMAGAPEAADMTEELVAMGVPFEEAAEWGTLYGLAAGGVETVSDLPLLGILFKPLQKVTKPLWTTILKGTASRLGKSILTGVIVTQTEGLEEAITQAMHNAILKHYDETVSILDGVRHAYIQGVIASLPFGVIGGAGSFRTFRANLSETAGQQYDAIVNDLQDAGLTEQQARVQAANEMARTIEGELEISRAIEAAQQEYWAEHPEMRVEVTPTVPEMAENVLQEAKIAEEMARKVTPEYATLAKGDVARIISRYGDVPVGREGTVVKSWTDPRTGNKWATLDFGVNLSGQRLRNSYPTNVLEKAAIPTAKAVTPEAAGVTAPIDRSIHWRVATKTGLATVSITKEGKYQFTPAYPSTERKVFDSFEAAITELSKVGAIIEVNMANKTSKPFVAIPKAKAAIPEAAPGMPEAGLQPALIEGVPAKEIRPEARGKLVQSRLDDYLRLREYNAKAVTDRISEIKKLLETKGRLPKDLGLKGNLRIELARLEALQELDGVETVEELDHLIKQVAEELGLRSMPYAGYGGKSKIDLVRHPWRRLFKEYTSKQLDEILKVYQQARQKLSPEIPATSVVQAADIPTDTSALTTIALTPRQIERTVALFKEAVAAPNSEMQRAAAIELRKHVFAQRAQAASESAQAMIAEGMNPEEAIKAAEQMFMTGKLPDVTTDYFRDLTQEMRNVLFGKVYNYWKDKSWTELISTFEALTNALAGRSIPRVKGIGTKHFPDGGSAWDRLARVFVGDMEVLEALDQGKSLSGIIEGIYLETGRGSVPLSQETVNWLKTLSTISADERLLLEKPLSEVTEVELDRIAQGWFWQRKQELDTLLAEGVVSQEEYSLQLAIAKDKAFPHKAISPAVSYPSETFEQLPLLTLREKGTIVRTLKNIGLTIIDIGNLIRANKASFDFSFWRQARALTFGHPLAFYRSNIDAWKGMWSQVEAEAQWQRITRDADFELYEEIRVKTGADPLRILEVPKGTGQWQAAEEFGYLTGERPIPRFTARIPWIKVSGRAFVAGCNSIAWSVWKQCLAATRARAMRIASGDIKLAEGEGFSIYEEMADYQKYIADAIQRASLGKAAPLAPALGSMFFAPRSKLARLLYPRHLISSNPRVRALAWKDFSLFVGTISSMVMLGYWLGLWDVERDPRNAQFMSIRIGNMRIDPWAGHRQFLVLYARLITGTGISSVTGQEYEVNPIAALTTFFRNSLAPLPSILLDFWTGKNFLGEEVEIANPKQWLERISPFAIQDIWEAFQDDWQNGLIAILPAIVGEGVQTYTGDWAENWRKLGLPKYLENTGYGIYEPAYDLADFWADTAAQFRGVDPATLTESKGYPEYVRSIAQALQIIEAIELLPNKRLASLNADPEEGTTFQQYYQMWQERQKIVASGNDEALKAFDADERTRNAYLGNMTQAQYALLMEYHSLPESQKAAFLLDHPDLYVNPREDWLRSHPDENALLALWDKAKPYSSEALDKLSSLAQSLGIPESAMIARDLDVVTLLRLKHKDLFALLDVYGGLDDETKDAEGLTARDKAVQELYANNPGFRDDMRRIEALSEGTEDVPTSPEIVEGWVDRGIIVDEFGASSAEARLWLLDNKEIHQWALGQALLTDDGTDWNEPILRLIVQYRDQFDLHDAYGDISSDRYISDDKQRAEARRRLLFDDQENMTSFGKAYYTRQAASDGYSESNWNAYVEYSGLPLWGSWRERFLLDNPSLYKEYTDPKIGKHPLLDTAKVKPLARDRIYEQFYDEFQAWDETGGMAPKAIENMRAELDGIERGGLTFQEARYSVQAYDKGFPEKLIDDYVEWYSTSRKGYEDDWWLMDHPEFYRAMYDLGIWTEKRDFSKVPTREVWGLYETYLGLPSGTPRLDFRAKHPDLDAWLVLKFGYKPVEGRGDTTAEKTPWEEAAEIEAFKKLFG